MKDGASISKKWRLAVKDGIFEGTFREFAELYNGITNENAEQSMEETFDENYSSDNAATDSTTITPEDKKPLDKQAPKGDVEILGMKKKTFFIVTGVVIVATAVGVYLFINRVKGEKTQG